MSLFANFGRRLIEARERQARAQVNAILSRLSDETLERAGLSRADIEPSAKADL
ncbi:MAG: hypothetical protein KDJ80_03930 [Nitratireductor sp.]|nr:hypothetical protein [Nitratireductor sp.]